MSTQLKNIPAFAVVPAALAAKGAQWFIDYITKHKELPEGCVPLNVDGKPVFRGEVLYALKATHGFPLDFALDRIFSAGWVVDWVAFIEAARRDGRWDYQTLKDLQHAFEDIQLDKATMKAIIDRFKIYVTNNEHPLLK